MMVADYFGRADGRGWTIQAFAGVFAMGAGWLAARLHLPLPWILGPLLTTAAMSIMGLRMAALQRGRRFGQVMVGAEVGLGLSAQVLNQVLISLPLMVGTSLFAVVLGALLAVPFAWVTRIDKQTAFFAMMPGGLAEMANIGSAAGAAAEPIALSQTIRLSLVVCVLPAFLVAFGLHGNIVMSDLRGVLPVEGTALTLACALVGVAVTEMVRLNNPWMIGAIVGAGVLATTGVVKGHIPVLLYDAGQILIGMSIGARFRRESVLQLMPVCVATVVFVTILSSIMFGFASLLTRIGSLDLGTAVLSTSVGGIAEMTLTAQLLQFDVTMVMAFHFFRAVVVNGFAAHVWFLLARIWRR